MPNTKDLDKKTKKCKVHEKSHQMQMWKWKPKLTSFLCLPQIKNTKVENWKKKDFDKKTQKIASPQKVTKITTTHKKHKKCEKNGSFCGQITQKHKSVGKCQTQNPWTKKAEEQSTKSHKKCKQATCKNSWQDFCVRHRPNITPHPQQHPKHEKTRKQKKTHKKTQKHKTP